MVGATSNHHEWTPPDQKEGSLDGAGVALDWGSTRAREAPEPTVPTVTAGYFVQYRVPPVWGPDYDIHNTLCQTSPGRMKQMTR